MIARFHAVEEAGKRRMLERGRKQLTFSQTFGAKTFNRQVMQRRLPGEVIENVLSAMEGKEKIRPEFSDRIATAMKEWAMEMGATHYTHWFQPLTGASAEKHDAFIDWCNPGQVIEKFSGKELIRGEPDASSFPSGGLRSTFEARGYTGWDPSSAAFIWEGGDGATLCIPCVFFSWTGDALDNKIPLLRSEHKLQNATMRLLKFTGIEANIVYNTLGFEQEYFVVDRALRNCRADLVLLGKTVQGADSPKGQQLQDHYFGSVKDRILSFMRDFEEEAVKIAIPVKTRHNEVAPAQHEVAPVYEKASIAVDHNILLMELMRKIAPRHELSVLLHEKPFRGLNGSGKHCNWSLLTDSGINLLDPTETPENNAHFLILLTAILHAVHKHAELLRASIGSVGNDARLGGHEAPPAIISVYLGEPLERLLDDIETKGAHTSSVKKGRYDFGIIAVPSINPDNTDRNRTSPFAFTGNKFEFRAPGASLSPAFAATTLNAIVADSLDELLDQAEQYSGTPNILQAILPIVQKMLKESRPIRYSGDNYSQEWVKEAKKRGLPNISSSLHAFEALKSKKTQKAFEGVLKPHELHSRYEIMGEMYALNVQMETHVLQDLFETALLPAALKMQMLLAKSIKSYLSVFEGAVLSHQKERLMHLTSLIEEAISLSDELKNDKEKAKEALRLGDPFPSSDLLNPKLKSMRSLLDRLEEQIDDEIWPLPKYRELLFIV